MYSALVNTFNHLTIRDQYEEYDEDSSSSASEDKIDETPSVVDEKENILERANRAEVATSTGHTPSKINQNEEKKSRVCVFIPEDLDSQASTQQVAEDNNSPSPVQRFKFKEFDDMGQFLGSPERKNKAARFKICKNESEADQFYKQQEEKIISIDFSIEYSSSSPVTTEPKLPFKMPDYTSKTKFRSAIEKKDNELFDKLVSENPGFIIDFSADKPTVLHEGCRHNVMHIAPRSSNSYAVRKTLELVKNLEWLKDAYGTDKCVAERSENLLTSLINTPDKISSSTPLHFASEYGDVEIVELLLSNPMCNMEPKNKKDETPTMIRARRLEVKKKKEEMTEEEKERWNLWKAKYDRISFLFLKYELERSRC